jgi:hypothetical protein
MKSYEQQPPSFGLGKLLFAIVFAILLFLLTQSMVHQRFFRGGHPNHLESLEK